LRTSLWPTAILLAPKSVGLALAGALLLLPHLDAQTSGSGAILGRVLADSVTPLAQARVRVVGQTAVAVSGDDGRFSFSSIPSGSQVLEVRRLGYIASVQWIKIVPGETLTLQITLTLVPVPLKAVEVRGAAPLLPAMQGFEERRAHGNGHFFDRAEIARMQPRVFTDVLRRVPGVQVGTPTGGSFGGNEMVRMNRATGVAGMRQCPVLFYINGMPFQITGDMSINQYVAPEDVVAIEVYSGSSQIPPEFQAGLMNARCGVILIWTRVGNEEDHPPVQPPSGELVRRFRSVVAFPTADHS
jgi:hypothetical protein